MRKPGAIAIPAISRRLQTDPKTAGFTFLEVLVAMLVLSIAALGGVALINGSILQLRRGGALNEINALIETDLAAVRTANDRLVCANGACSISADDLNSDEFFPAAAADIPFFENLCSYRTGTAGSFTFAATSGFAEQLRTRLPAANARIARGFVVENEGHRYTLTYSSNGLGNDPQVGVLRQVTLTPATTAWCPCIPSVPIGSITEDSCPPD